jgi:hypothetical protein
VSIVAALLKKLGERIAPGPIVLDLAAHKETCLRCRDHALCVDGRRIVKAAGEALQAGAGMKLLLVLLAACGHGGGATCPRAPSALVATSSPAPSCTAVTR